VTILREAIATAKDSPENVRMEIYRAIVAANAVLGRAGDINSALRVLQVLRSDGLKTIPAGSNRVDVALQMSKLYRKLGNANAAHSLVLDILSEIPEEHYQMLDAAIEFHHVGDDQQALILLAAYSPLVDAPRPNTREDGALTLAHFADAYRKIGDSKKKEQKLQEAIELALSMPRKTVVKSDEARNYVEYFRFRNAIYFTRYLVQGGHLDAVSSIALREGNVQVRVDVFVAAAIEAFRTGKTNDASRFMSLAAGEASAETAPFQRSRTLIAVADGYKFVGREVNEKSSLLEALLAARSIPEAYVSATRLDGAVQKLEVMIGIADRLMNFEPWADGLRVLDEAEALSRRTTTDPSYYLPGLTEAVARSGQLELAVRIAERVRDGNTQLQAFGSAIRGYAFYKDPAMRKRMDAERHSNAQDEE
jgi:tetratricopeptide (TPR) repeat protein